MYKVAAGGLEFKSKQTSVSFYMLKEKITCIKLCSQFLNKKDYKKLEHFKHCSTDLFF